MSQVHSHFRPISQVVSTPGGSNRLGRGQCWRSGVRDNRKLLISSGFSYTSRSPSTLRPVSLPAAAPYPAGTGGAAILPGIALNSRRVRWPPASIRQSHRACLISLPPVFASRCRKLVGKQLSILLGRNPGGRPRIRLSDGDSRPRPSCPAFGIPTPAAVVICTGARADSNSTGLSPECRAWSTNSQWACKINGLDLAELIRQDRLRVSA